MALVAAGVDPLPYDNRGDDQGEEPDRGDQCQYAAADAAAGRGDGYGRDRRQVDGSRRRGGSR